MNKTMAISGAFALPALGQKQAHVWYVNLEKFSENDARWKNILSVQECERAARFRFPRDQRRFTVTRALLRILLATYLSTEPEGLSFSATDHGKPSLCGLHGASDLQFNVSHSAEMVLFGITCGSTIGVDVESIRQDFDVAAIAKRFFSAAEQCAFASLPVSQQHRAFFDCWTRKEAYVKALGEGLSHPLHQFDVSLLPGEPARLLATRPDPEEVKQWTLAAVNVGPEYCAAVVVKAHDMEIQCRELPKLA